MVIVSYRSCRIRIRSCIARKFRENRHLSYIIIILGLSQTQLATTRHLIIAHLDYSSIVILLFIFLMMNYNILYGDSIQLPYSCLHHSDNEGKILSEFIGELHIKFYHKCFVQKNKKILTSNPNYYSFFQSIVRS